jgi:protein ImuA
MGNGYMGNGCGGSDGHADVAEFPCAGLSSGRHSDLPGERQKLAVATLKAYLSGWMRRPAEAASGAGWTLGATEIDALLGPAGLDSGGVHHIALAIAAHGLNVRPGAGQILRGSSLQGQSVAAVSASARLFALMLLRRRLAQCPDGRVLWCALPSDLGEGGHPYAPALARMGFDPGQFLFVAPQRRSDVLWAMEEGLRSNALAAVVGQVGDVELTPARRLALAAAAANTPCLLVADVRAGPVAAVATRWRIGPLPTSLTSGGRRGGERRAPWRISVGLERCRSRPVGSGSEVFTAEWSDDAHCFRVVAGSADRAAAPGTKSALAAGRAVELGAERAA